MKQNSKMHVVLGLICLLASSLAAAELDTGRIERITGLRGNLNQTEGVFRISTVHTNVPTIVDGWPLPGGIGPTSWASFTKGKTAEAMVIGEFALLQDEVNAVLSIFMENKISVIALNNLYFYEEPRLFSMHITSEGTIEHLAGAIRKALDRMQQIRRTHKVPLKGFVGVIARTNALTADVVEKSLGLKGETDNGLVKIVLGRSVKTAKEVEIGEAMGVRSWATFGGSERMAVLTGEFALKDEELQPVLATLRQENFFVLGIRNHLAGEHPRLTFVRYWGKGRIETLAKSLSAILTKNPSVKEPK